MISTVKLTNGEARLKDIKNSSFIELCTIKPEDIISHDIDTIKDIVDSHLVCDTVLSPIDYILVMLHWRNMHDGGDIIIPHNVDGKEVKLNIGKTPAIIEKVREMKFDTFIVSVEEFDIGIELNPLSVGSDIIELFKQSAIFVVESPANISSIELGVDTLDDLIQTQSFVDSLKRFIKSNEDNSFNIIKFKDELNIDISPLSILKFALSLIHTKIDIIYEQKFMFINRLNSTNDHYMNSTQQEVQALLKLTQQDIERQNAEYNKQSSSTKMPSMPKIPKH
tara:strand:+ start:3237 stop:4076 length:840 start_codon:yes stop_codon:yes gene_type:complete